MATTVRCGEFARNAWRRVARTGGATSSRCRGGDHPEADLVLIAIGYDGPTHSALLDELSVAFTDAGNLAVDESDFACASPGVFAAGDAVRGASLIVWAIAEGRAAARTCDAYLTGAVRLP